MAFADAEAARCVTGESWLSEALTTWEIEVEVAELDPQVIASIRAAQDRQMMINLDVTPDAPE